jgi:NAD(P)-dependent dehydrogenase (short-subunit alcohol dehydrogenase family)
MSEPLHEGRVAGKVALVTGGANGIGRAICEVLGEAGATVAVGDIDIAAAQALASTLRSRGIAVSAWALDVTDGQSVAAWVAGVVAEHGVPDVLVNNAGIPGPAAPTHEVDEEDFDAVYAVNVKGVFLCTKQVVRTIHAAGASASGRSIVNIASINGVIGNHDIPTYHGTKGAVRLMTKTDAVLYARDGIRVNCIHPGSIRTPLSERVAGEHPDGPEAYFAALAAAHPLGRQGEPRDIGYGVLYLASDEAAFVTGSELVIDGGYTAQ